MISYNSKIKQQMRLVWILAKTDFKLRYYGSILGFFWALLKPLLIFLILNFVFSNIFLSAVSNYSLKLLTGLIIWSLFTDGTMVGLTSLLSKAGIITKIYFPRWVVVVASTLHILLTFAVSLLILTIFFLYYGVYPSIQEMALFFGCSIMIYMMILIFSFTFSPIFLRIRDLNQIWDVLLTAGFYAAPIIYPITSIPDHVRFVAYLNPMTFVIEWSKQLLIDNNIPNLLYYFSTMIGLFFGVIVTFIIFQKTSLRSAENI